MGHDITTLKSTRKTADVDSASIYTLEVCLKEIKIRLVELSGVTERNEAAIREAKNASKYKVFVHNGVNLAHMEVMRRY